MEINIIMTTSTAHQQYLNGNNININNPLAGTENNTKQ